MNGESARNRKVCEIEHRYYGPPGIAGASNARRLGEGGMRPAVGVITSAVQTVLNMSHQGPFVKGLIYVMVAPARLRFKFNSERHVPICGDRIPSDLS